MIRWMLGWILDGSWIDFWWILGPSWEASWHQVGTKIQKMRVPRGGQKMSGKKVGIGNQFLGPREAISQKTSPP